MNPIKKIGFLFLLFSLPFGKLLAQERLLDSLTLDTLTAFTNLEDALKDPDKVIKLELRRKHLKTFPREIFKFKNLQYLDLTKNGIEEIPAEIAQLTDLQYFSISKNELSTLPAQIGDLVWGQGSPLHGRTDFALSFRTMASGALRLVSGGSVGGKGRQSDRDRQRADNEKNNEFRESHEIAPPVMSTEIINQRLYQ